VASSAADEECGVVWAEIHVFQGRMYVTQQWGSTGVRVDDGISDRKLGKVILEQLGRPAVATLRFGVPQRPGERTPWQTFCEDVVGVPVRRFRPEKRVRALKVAGGWQVDAKPHDVDAPAWAVAASEGPRGLGAAVRHELASIDPRWPMVRRVIITTAATHQLVVMPSIDGYTVGPARILGPAIEATALREAVRAALADADVERKDAPAYAAALSAGALDPRLLDGGAQVILDELSDGTVRLTGNGTAGGSDTEDQTWLGRIDDLADVCAAAAAMIGGLPTQHLAPGTPTGTSFGYKCIWLAVRGSSLDEVAAAVGLTGTRSVDWDEGVHAAYDRQVFVSPPTAGWVFVVSAMLPFDGLAVAALSARLGTEVQYFRTHRVSEYHEWAYATGGRLVRRLCCNGSSGTFEQEGPATAMEIKLGVPAMTSDDWRISEETVMQVAAAWSIDPTTLHLVESSTRTGICGTARAAV
jgi:hypothetical protein